MISTDQRRAAYGLVIVLCAAWLALGVILVVSGFLVMAVPGIGVIVTAAAALVSGIRFVRQVDAGVWPWRSVVVTAGIGCVASALAGWWFAGYLPVVALLLAFQIVLLASLAALLHPLPVN